MPTLLGDVVNSLCQLVAKHGAGHLGAAVLGAVHKVRHATFAQFWSPLLCHTLSHIPDTPKVRHTSRTPPDLL